MNRILFALFAGGCLPVACAALEISEILPENEGGLQDADFNSPGWIEIYNNEAAAVSLDGWSLTDDPALPAKWRFPSQTLAAGARLVVFASGKNRAVAGMELHANFKLNPDGEYLALVMPDGFTRASEFNPFPKLRRNVSWAYQTGASVNTVALAEGAEVKWHVPGNDSLGSAWTGLGFDDGSWTGSATGLGFDSAAPVARLDIKTPTSAGSIPAPAGWTGLSFSTLPESGSSSTSSASVTAGGVTLKLDAVGAGLVLATRNRSGGGADILANSATLNNVAEDFVFASTSSFTNGIPRGMDVTLSGAGILPDTAYFLTLHAYDRSSSTFRSAVWTDATGGASAALSFNGSDGQLADDAAFQARSVVLPVRANAAGQILLQGRAASAGSTSSHNVFLNAVQVHAVSYLPFIATSLAGPLQGNASSLYVRASFTLTNPSAYQTLRLRVRYDDGFLAWLNGQPVASRNAPAVAAWNSAATADRTKEEALQQEEITAAIPPGLLVSGVNVVAFQGLKQGASDGDFLLLPTVDLAGTLPPGGVYYATPTPGAANDSPSTGLVGDTAFSVDRRYFSAPFTTAITCPTPGAEIRYTLDGSVPTATTGSIYTAPLTISSTTVVRAAAFVPGWIPSNAVAQSYLLASAIAAQPASPPGWPATWGNNSEVNSNDGAGDGTVPANYAMDQRVAAGALDGYGIADALQSIPTLSIALNPADFLGANGIYQNPQSSGAAWERDCSVEMINPAAADEGFHETCRIEIHGNSSRRPWRMQKHSLRLSFKGQSGSTKLRYRFFPGSGASGFDKLVLRATFTDGWGLVSWDPARYRPDDSVMMRDVWVRRTWESMGNLSPQSRYVHVVINGLYWGVYDVAEHIDADFLALHEGGEPADFEVVSDFVDPDSSPSSAWKSMFNAAAAGLASPAAYAAIQQWLDPVNFADYYLMHQFCEAEDWPHHNGAAWRRKSAGAQYRWLAWDQEIALDNHSINRISSGAPNTSTARTPGPLWNALRANAEWRLLVADRAHFLLNNGGPLSVLNCQNRWMQLAAQLDKAIVAESARWGDTAVETPYGNTESRPGVPLKDPYLRETDWLPTVLSVRDSWLPSLHERANSFALITRLASQNPRLWPATEPPVLAKHGGIVSVGYSLTMTAPTSGSAIYYTTDGSDPRQAVTGNAVGSLYTLPPALTQSAVVRARAVTGTPGSGSEIWSALTVARFVVGAPASAASLAVSKIHYNPATSSDHEFLELVNFSSEDVDLSGCSFSGITFTFPQGTVLAAGARLLVVRNLAAFAGQFGPGLPVAGQFVGALDNVGEEIALTNPKGADIFRFAFDDQAPWPTDADGGGPALVFQRPGSSDAPGDPASWRPSRVAGGLPGADDRQLPAGDPAADADGDDSPAGLEAAFGTSDISGSVRPEFSVLVSPAGEALLVSFRHAPWQTTGRLVPENSESLAAWTTAGNSLVSRVLTADGSVEDLWRVPLPTGSETPRHFVRVRLVP